MFVNDVGLCFCLSGCVCTPTCPGIRVWIVVFISLISDPPSCVFKLQFPFDVA